MTGRVEMNGKGKKEGDHSSSFLFFFHESPVSLDITMVCHNLVPRVSPLPFSLHFKARLSAKSLFWKSLFIHIEIGTNYQNIFAPRLVLKERLKGTRKWPIALCQKQQRKLVVTLDTSSLWSFDGNLTLWTRLLLNLRVSLPHPATRHHTWETKLVRIFVNCGMSGLIRALSIGFLSWGLIAFCFSDQDTAWQTISYRWISFG